MYKRMSHQSLTFAWRMDVQSTCCILREVSSLLNLNSFNLLNCWNQPYRPKHCKCFTWFFTNFWVNETTVKHSPLLTVKFKMSNLRCQDSRWSYVRSSIYLLCLGGNFTLKNHLSQFYLSFCKHVISANFGGFCKHSKTN